MERVFGRAVFLLFSVILAATVNCKEEQEGPVIPPSTCEVCKYLTVELKDRLEETGKSKEVLRTGHGIDESKKKAVAYKKSELRLIEALNEPHICDKILQYNIHKERKGSLRFAKGRSETFETLHGLVDKGVKVDLGIPYELWDTPSAEVTQLQRECFNIVERYEEDIEDWYFSDQEQDLTDVLCRRLVVPKSQQGCLEETFVPKVEDKSDSGDSAEKKKDKKKKKKKQQKGDVGKGDKPEKTEL